MSTITVATTEDKKILIEKLQNQITRLEVKKTHRVSKMENINSKLKAKNDLISTTGDSSVLVSKKFEEKNKKDSESLEKGLAKRNNRLQRFEKRLTDLTTRIESYKLSISEWTEKRSKLNQDRAAKRAKTIKSISIEGIKDFIEKKEMYLSILEERNLQADKLISEKSKQIEKIKTEIENSKSSTAPEKKEETKIEVPVTKAVKKVEPPKVIKQVSKPQAKQPIKPITKK